MRSYLGNITFYKDRQVEAEPEREKLRLIVRDKYRTARASRDGLEHMTRIMGETGLAHTIEEFFDSDGNPPRRVTPAALMRQYKQMCRQAEWIKAINAEVEERMKALSPARYYREKAEEKRKKRERTVERDTAYRDYLKTRAEGEVLPPKTREAIREALMKELDHFERKNSLTDETLTAFDILGSRQIEKMLQCLFRDYSLSKDTEIPDDPQSQYEFLGMGLQEMMVMAEEFEDKLYALREIIESTDIYMGGLA